MSQLSEALGSTSPSSLVSEGRERQPCVGKPLTVAHPVRGRRSQDQSPLFLTPHEAANHSRSPQAVLSLFLFCCLLCAKGESGSRPAVSTSSTA